MASSRTVLGIVGGVGVILLAGWFALDEHDSVNPVFNQPSEAPSVVEPAVVGTEAPVSQMIAEAPAPEITRAVPSSQDQVRLSFAPVVSAVAPAVVNVYATRVEQRSASPFANDPFFQRFFGGRTPYQSRPQTSQSLGSGVIIDPSGLILTNSHVVSGATDIRIALTDRRELGVELVLDDPETDLAVLRLSEPETEPLPSLGFADSDTLEVGDLVLAIGNPFGVGQTVTSGIVSALARTGVEASDYEFFIQTDAAINPGNSGGALVDLDGNLVGINTAIFSRSGGSVGIGFAIPSNMARVVADAGSRGGDIVRPWLGARLQPVTPELAESLQLSSPSGALVNEVAPTGPAMQAGLQTGDVITAIDGVPVTTPATLNFRLATMPLGTEAELSVVRRGETVSLNLPVEAPSGGTDVSATTIEGNTRFAGATAETLQPALAEQYGLSYEASGVVITDVAASSPASAMGLATGDVILTLNGIEIENAETFSQLASQRQRVWEIVLQRNGRVIRTRVSG
ncbi:serine protease [Devosia pacifica]|uniref:Serine protease n=1 Tax=Devosia pacifica TaxID=1335967 RepID=A0A918VP47_9HYPH|nr:Do family serine endopeptidase [Devosia pacifica]GHA12735.1 serine protease [Devosia pacifica]